MNEIDLVAVRRWALWTGSRPRSHAFAGCDTEARSCPSSCGELAHASVQRPALSSEAGSPQERQVHRPAVRIRCGDSIGMSIDMVNLVWHLECRCNQDRRVRGE